MISQLRIEQVPTSGQTMNRNKITTSETAPHIGARVTLGKFTGPRRNVRNYKFTEAQIALISYRTQSQACAAVQTRKCSPRIPAN